MLTAKQKRFVEAYDGSVKKAAKQSGLSYDYCRQMVTKPHIVAALRNRESTRLNPLIATRLERQSFWTEIMKDQAAEMRDRLKASELLGKSEADFIDRRRHEGEVDISVVVNTPAKPTMKEWQEVALNG